MKTVKTITIGILLTVCCLQSSAQHGVPPLNEPDLNKPALFADVPQRMNLKITDLESLLDLPVGAKVNTAFSDNFHFIGTIVSKSDEHDNSVKSIVVRSTNRQGASFTFTKAKDADGSYNYLGRIISMKNKDAFEILKEDGIYILQKKNLYDLMNE